MKIYRFLFFVVILSSLAALPAIHSTAASNNNYTIPPDSYTDQSGIGVGDIAALTTLDQGLSDDNPASYVLFTTPRKVYKGFRTYTLPASVLRSTVSALNLYVNYKGLPASSQTWRWYAYKWNTASWTLIGTNKGARKNIWKTFSFNIATPLLYVNSSGQMLIQLRSSNASGNAKIDYEAINLTYAYTPTPMPTSNTSAGGSTNIENCSVYPADNVWNTAINNLPVHARSDAWINTIGRYTGFHMDFGSGTWDDGPIGIPYNVVSGSQVTKYSLDFYYPDESDAGPYPISNNPAREWGSDHHILTVDTDTCYLYEIYDASYSNGDWSGGSGAIWDLNSNDLRPAGWTSADAAGLPILPGLVRYQEIEAGSINHAIRFTVPSTNSYIWPARHLTSGTPGTLTNTPPMGARFRLKASYDISGFSPELQVILQAMKTYGVINADNGSAWYVSGSPDERWNNDMLHDLDVLRGNNFEAVDESCLIIDINSAQANPSGCP